MKKLAIIVLALGLLFCGCAPFQNLVNSAQGVMCNPTAQQQADAAAGVAAADGLLAVLQLFPQTSGVASLIVSLGGAKVVLSTVQSGGCVALTALQQALDAIDQANVTQKALLAPKGLKVAPLGVPMVQVPLMQSLRSAVK